MAFLCPARRGRKQKVKQPELPAARITGSDSIDTLVRVGIEKQRQQVRGTRSEMVVLHDFRPCVDDELEVKRNQVVELLYQENDWMYVISKDGKEGFVPYTYCLPLQRSVDDFVVHKTKKARDVTQKGDSSKLISPPPYKSKHKTVKNAKSKRSKNSTKTSGDVTATQLLTRNVSRSLPELSDVSSEAASVTYQGGLAGGDVIKTYSKQNGSARHLKQNRTSATKTLTSARNSNHADVTSSRQLTSNENNAYISGLDDILRDLIGRDEEEEVDSHFLDTSVNDLRNVSVALRDKHRLFGTKTPAKPRPSSAHVTRDVIAENNVFPSNNLQQARPMRNNYVTGAKDSIIVKSEPSSPRRHVTSQNQTSVTSRGIGAHDVSMSHDSNVLLAHEQYDPRLASSPASRTSGSSRVTPMMYAHDVSVTPHSYFESAPVNNRSRINSAGAVMLNSSWPTQGVRSHTPHMTSHPQTLHQSWNTHAHLYSSSRSYTGRTHHTSMTSHARQHTSFDQQSMTSAATSASQRSRKFSRVMADSYVALFDFIAQQENDVSIDRGEAVTVLNTDDSDWFWVRKQNLHEGFVPSNYVRRIDMGS